MALVIIRSVLIHIHFNGFIELLNVNFGERVGDDYFFNLLIPITALTGFCTITNNIWSAGSRHRHGLPVAGRGRGVGEHVAAVLPRRSLPPPASHHPPHRPSERDTGRQETLLPGGRRGGNPGLLELPQDAPGPTATGARLCSGGLGGQKKGGALPRQRQIPKAPSRWHLGRAFRTAALGTGVSRAPHDPRHPTTPGTPRLHSMNTGLRSWG